MAVLVATVLTAGCAATAPPSGWQQGGRRLAIPQARWVVGERVVELTPAGQVLLDGEHRLTIDGAGRVLDEEARPIAMLKASGHLIGTGDEPLGWVGADEALDPEEGERWLHMLPSGELLRTSGEVQRPFGVWLGCDSAPYGTQTCLLVSQLMAIELRQRAANVGVGVGVGIGIRVP